MQEKIVLLDDSFVSEILISTVKKNNVPVFALGNLKEKLAEKGVKVLSEKEAIQKLSSDDCLVYSNSEKFIPLISKNHSSKDFVKAIRFFKNKCLFREMVSDFCPNFFFKKLKASDADLFKPIEGKKFVLKPCIGFLSLGVKQFSSKKEFDAAIFEALNEISSQKKAFDSSIICEENFLIEEKIGGEEFACDAFFNENGKPVILGLYSHPFKNETDFRDIVYFTGKNILKENLKKTKEFLFFLSKKVKVKKFPIHFEFRINSNGELIPIEVNPLRFGGFGLADLSFHAFGINSYDCFLSQKEFEWEKVLGNAGKEFNAFVLGRMEGIKKPNLEKFRQSFEKLKGFVELDFKKFPLFCTAFVQSNDLNEIKKYLFFDFKEYNLP